MNPEEKAKELVNKMFNCDKSTPEEAMAMLYPHAKQCALITADEMLENSHTSTFTKYWQQVKHEIEQL